MIRKSEEMATELRANMRGGAGTVTIQHIFKPDEIAVKTRLCAKLIIPPSAGIGLHKHEREDELFFVLKGEGVIEEDGKSTLVKPGDAILTGRGGAHAVRNESHTDLELLAVIMCYE